jgi:hypothetical protein
VEVMDSEKRKQYEYAIKNGLKYLSEESLKRICEEIDMELEKRLDEIHSSNQ